MGKREDAQEFLRKMRSCRPNPLYIRLNESQRGIGFVLDYLRETQGEVIAGDLARELGVSTARIAALLKKMEKNGLIKRHSSSTDARQTVVEITVAGTEYSDKVKEQILEKTELLMEKVGREDLNEFIRISQKIKNSLEEEEKRKGEREC